MLIIRKLNTIKQDTSLCEAKIVFGKMCVFMINKQSPYISRCQIIRMTGFENLKGLSYFSMQSVKDWAKQQDLGILKTLS